MKKNQAEQWMLLEESGELSERRRRRLRAALEADPALAALKRDWQALVSASRSDEVGDEPGAFVRERILSEARRNLEAPLPLRAAPLWRPAWAAAAAAGLLLFVAGLAVWRGGAPDAVPAEVAALDEWEQDFSSRLEGLEASLSELVQLWAPQSPSGNGRMEDDEELQQLGQLLIELEG